MTETGHPEDASAIVGAACGLLGATADLPGMKIGRAHV